MPDVGVLNLQIKSDSSQAAQGLNNLAGALERVRNAVNKSGLNSVVGALQRINKAINDFRLDGTIENLNGVASALKRIKEASDFTLPNLKGAGNFKKAADEANKSADAVKKAKEAVQNAAKGAVSEGSTGFTDMASDVERARDAVDALNASLERTASLMQNLGWSNGQPGAGVFGSAFNAFSDVRSGRALAGGQGLLGAGQNAIPVEGWVTDAADTMRQQALPAAEEIGSEVNSIISYSENINNQWSAIVARWTEAERLGRQMAEVMRQQAVADSIAKSNRIAGPMAAKYNDTKPYERRRATQQQIFDLRNALNQMTSPIDAAAINQMLGMNNGVKSAEDSARVFMEQMGNSKSLSGNLQTDTPELSRFKQTMDDAGASAHTFNSKLENVDKELKSKKKDASTASKAVEAFGNSLKLMPLGMIIGKLSQLGHQFLNIGRRMLMRAIWKEMAKGFSEGIENVYRYSQAIGGSFATSMDNAASSLATMKNSIGAAVAPAIQSLIPILQQVVSWCITAFNYLNQFLALLRGQTSWTKAVDQQTKAYEDNTKAAKGAGSAAKDMLAAWDELNVISQNGGGGGGGGAGAAAADYANMFEEMTVFDEKIKNLVQTLKDAVSWIEEHMNSVLGIILAIKAGIWAWQLSQALTGWLGLLAGWVATGAAIAVTLQATWLLTNKYLETGDIGWLWASALTSAVGSVAAWAIAKKLIGGKAGLWAASFTLFLSGLTNIIAAIKDVNVNGLNDRNIRVALLGALGIGAGTSLALIAAGVALGTAVLAGAIVTGLTFGVVVGIMAIIDANRTQFEWGDITLTQEEARKFALEKMFDVDVESTITIIKSNVELAQDQRKNIETDLTKALGTLQVIRLGIANDEDNKQLKSEIDTLLSDVQAYIETAKETGKLTLQFTPTLFGEDTNSQEKGFTSNITGWNKVEDYYKKLGEKIGSCFVEGEKGEIILKSPELLQTLMSEMDKITSAVTESKMASKAYSEFALQLGDLSQASVEDVATYFGQYKDELKTQYEALVSEQYQQQGALVAALGAIDPNSQEYKDALATWQYMGEHLHDAVEEGVASATASGKQLVLDWLTGKLGGKVSAGVYASDAWKQVLDANNITPDGLQQAMKTMFHNLGVPDTVLNIMDLVEISGWDFLDDDLKKSMFDTVYEAIGNEAVPLLAQSLQIPIKDMVKVVDWSKFESAQQLQFILSMSEAYGAKETIEAVKAAGVDVGAALQAGIDSTNPDTKAKTEALVETIRQELASKGVEIPVDATVDALVNATVEVEATSNTAKIQAVSSSASTVASAIATYTGATGLMNSAKKLVKGHAAGAYDIPTGELFMARENGVTEYVGTIGGKASVANNDQIVDGISKGVADANADQNRLLREQNDLLRRILAKEYSVNLGSKAQFGRTVRQSLDAYESMVGG